MSTTDFRRRPGSSWRNTPWILFAVSLSLLAGCASTGDQVSGAMQVTLKPGDTGNCVTSVRKGDWSVMTLSGGMSLCPFAVSPMISTTTRICA